MKNAAAAAGFSLDIVIFIVSLVKNIVLIEHFSIETRSLKSLIVYAVKPFHSNVIKNATA